MRFLFLLLPIAASAWHFDFRAGPGYRHDKLSFFLYDDLPPFQQVYYEKYKYLNIFQIEGVASLEHKNFFISARGDYGWVQKGKSHSRLNPGLPSQDASFFHTNASGHVHDLYSTGGYKIWVFKRFGIAPQGGYSWLDQTLKRSDSHPKRYFVPPVLGFSGLSFSLDLTRKELERRWHGPFAGIELLADFAQRWTARAGYAYHWLFFNQSSSIDIALHGTNPIPPNVEFNVNFTSRAKFSRHGGQRGWAEIHYEFASHWNVGLYANILSFLRGKKDSTLKHVETLTLNSSTSTTTFKTKNKLKARWQSYSISAELGFDF